MQVLRGAVGVVRQDDSVVRLFQVVLAVRLLEVRHRGRELFCRDEGKREGGRAIEKGAPSVESGRVVVEVEKEVGRGKGRAQREREGERAKEGATGGGERGR